MSSPRLKSGESVVRPMPARQVDRRLGVQAHAQTEVEDRRDLHRGVAAVPGPLLVIDVVMCDGVVTFSWNDTLVETLYDSA